MGCGTSKIENEEVVAQCSTRKKHVKEAVSSRHNFAAAFSGYVIALRTVGSAFSQFGEAEFRDPVTPPTSTSAPPSVFTTPVIKPRPPPLPHFYNPGAQQTPSTTPPVLDPLKRAASMPPLNLDRKTVIRKEPSLEKIPSTGGSTTPSPVKASKNPSKKKVKVLVSPLSPEPEVVSTKMKEFDDEKTLHGDVKGGASAVESNNNLKASGDEKEDWVATKPPPPPSGKAPPPPSPPKPSWLPDFFDVSTHPVPLQHDDEEDLELAEKKRREREEEEEEAAKRMKKLEEEREAQRKADEERIQKQQQEMKKQHEQMNVVSEGDEDEDGDESGEDEDEDEGEEGEDGEDGEEGEDDEDGEEGGEHVEDGEEDLKKQKSVNVESQEQGKKTVNLDLPKTDLVVATSNNNNNSKSLVSVLKEIDALFQEAYESGRRVASMLEAPRVSFHPNFIDGRSSETHAKKVLRAISWSTTTSASTRVDPPQSFDDDESGATHASTLDRLLAWEKKLFDEVKRAESIRVELEKKNAWIVREESRGGNLEAIEKAKATLKSLQTRFMVAIQGVDTARSAVLRLRDSELYPQLLELLKGIYEMWKKTHECHRRQYEQVLLMKKLDVSDVVESNSHLHKVATDQLKQALSRWHHFFGSVVNNQREYMRYLNLYVKVSVKPVDLEKERISPASPRLPISTLCHEWQLALDRLPDKRALEAIKNFVTELEVIVDLQKEETRHRKKVEQLIMDVRNKKIYVDKYEKKHLRSMNVPASEENGEVTVEVLRGPMTEKRAQLEVLMTRLEEEKEKVAYLEQKSKTQTINSLQMGLQHIFNTVTSFSKQCYDVHESLQEFANLTLLTDK